MKRYSVFFVILTAFFLHIIELSSANASDIFQEANKAFAEGKYDLALKLYEQTRTEGGNSAALFYNEGNAYYRLGLTGAAVLSYKRALYLDPSNPDAKVNLSFVLKDAGIVFSPPSRWLYPLRAFSLEIWAYSAIISFACLSLYVFFSGLSPLIRLRSGRYSGGGEPIKKSAVLSLSFAFLLSLSGIIVQTQQLREAVVISSDASMLVSPFDGASRLSTLKPGQILSIKKEFQDFLMVEAQNGQNGWIKKEALERVVA